MDATLAISEGGANTLMQKLISLASASASDSGSWGPFTVGYTANVALSGGTVSLLNAPVNRVRLNNVNVSGNVGASFTFDLGAILPQICIPPFRVCVNIPFVGRVCTPQVCIPWPPPLTIGVNIPFSVNVTAEFGLSVQSSGPNWEIKLLVFPFSLSIDLSPSAPLIISAIQAQVSATLGSIPGIGGLLAGLVNTVIGALTPVLSLILSAISGFVNGVIMLLNIFSLTVPITLLTFAKTQAFLPANVPSPGDPEVDVTIPLLTASILDQELVATANFA
jgi:hypothetical protein